MYNYNTYEKRNLNRLDLQKEDSSEESKTVIYSPITPAQVVKLKQLS